jgi:hypothetical protein
MQPGGVRVPTPKVVTMRQVKAALRQLKLGVVKAQRLLPEIIDWLDAIRLDEEWPRRFRLDAAKLIREVAELELKQQQDITHTHFVARIPPVMADAESWEEKYGGLSTIDVMPTKPHKVYAAPELPAIPQPEQPCPVRSGPQGHIRDTVRNA